MLSAFGVDHGEISKKVEHWTTIRDKEQGGVGAGRAVTGGFFPGVHGAIAGKKGKKLKAAGHELAGSVVGTALPGPGSLLGGAAGTNAAHNKGYYKGSKAIKLKENPHA